MKKDDAQQKSVSFFHPQGKQEPSCASLQEQRVLLCEHLGASSLSSLFDYLNPA